MPYVNPANNSTYLALVSTPLLAISAYKWSRNAPFMFSDGLILAAACGAMFLSVRSCLQKRQIHPVEFPPEFGGFSPKITQLDPYIEYLKKIQNEVSLKTIGDQFLHLQKRQSGNAPRINHSQIKQEANEFLDHVLYYYKENIDEPLSLELAKQLLNMGLDPCRSRYLLLNRRMYNPDFPAVLDLIYFQHPTPDVALNQVCYDQDKYFTLFDFLQELKKRDPNLYPFNELIEQVKEKGGISFAEIHQKLQQSAGESTEMYFNAMLNYYNSEIPLSEALLFIKDYEHLDQLEFIRLYANETAQRGSREWFKQLLAVFDDRIQNPKEIFSEAIKTLAQTGFSFNEIDRDGKTILDFLLDEQKRGEEHLLKHPHHGAFEYKAIMTTLVDILKDYGAKKSKDVQNFSHRNYPDHFSWSIFDT